jgi:hypothetical protein
MRSPSQRHLFRRIARQLFNVAAIASLFVATVVCSFAWIDRGTTMSRQIIAQGPHSESITRLFGLSLFAGRVCFGDYAWPEKTNEWQLSFSSDRGWSLGLSSDAVANEKTRGKTFFRRIGFAAGTNSPDQFPGSVARYTAVQVPAWFVVLIASILPLWRGVAFLRSRRRSTRNDFAPTRSGPCASSHS